MENKLTVTKGERGGGMNWEFGINRYTLLYMKQKASTLQHSTAQGVIIHNILKIIMEKNAKMNIYIYKTESLWCIPETNTTL